MVKTECRVCGNANDNKIYLAREMMFGFRDEFTYFECSICGCLQISEIPTNISKYYPAKYYSFSPIQPERLSSNPIKSIVKQFLSRRINRYMLFNHGVIGKLFSRRFPANPLISLSRIDLTQDSRILDVGCGSGSLLYTLKQAGVKNLLGIDKYIAEDIQFKNGPKIKKSVIQEINGEWDIIMFNHSFEHMFDQLETLQSASRLLDKHGVCLLNLPTVSSYAWKTYATKWVQLDAPRHFFLHSVKSLRMLAEKAELNFKDVSYNSTAFQFWGSEQYLRDIPLYSDRSFAENPSASIFTRSQIRAFERKAKELNSINQGDSAAFHFEKW